MVQLDGGRELGAGWDTVIVRVSLWPQICRSTMVYDSALGQLMAAILWAVAAFTRKLVWRCFGA